jgi:hypothetical protein
MTEPAAIRSMVRDWIAFDWLRVALGFTGFVAAIRAISIPYPARVNTEPASLTAKVFLALSIAIVLAFGVYFVSNVL